MASTSNIGSSSESKLGASGADTITDHKIADCDVHTDTQPSASDDSHPHTDPSRNRQNNHHHQSSHYQNSHYQSNSYDANQTDLPYQCRYLFPNPETVDPEGVGIIAIGADLDPQTLISAYAQGLFPWFNEGEPIAWWCPEPRCVLDPTTYKPSKSLKRLAKASQWQWSVNTAFERVITACSLPRSYAEDTWIHQDMIDAYTQLHKLGYAHSIEVWDNESLIGGLYGLKIGQIYFGESMFHTQSNASKIAFWALNNFCQHTHVRLIDCQLPNPHLQSLGAGIMPRHDFLNTLRRLIQVKSSNWLDFANQTYSVNTLHQSPQPNQAVANSNVNANINNNVKPHRVN